MVFSRWLDAIRFRLQTAARFRLRRRPPLTGNQQAPCRLHAEDGDEAGHRVPAHIVGDLDFRRAETRTFARDPEIAHGRQRVPAAAPRDLTLSARAG